MAVQYNIRAIGPRDSNPFPGVKVINTTSKSQTDWQIELSPFFLGPYTSPDGKIAQRFENLWQFSKVFPQHADSAGEPTEAWEKWRLQGFSDKQAHRYPMGKGKKPLYRWWGGVKLNYIDARKQIYVPIYAQLVTQTQAFQRLITLRNTQPIALFDYDAYDYVKLGIPFNSALNDPTRILGHGMVLCALLRGDYTLQKPSNTRI
jgi:hypothetical protein